MLYVLTDHDYLSFLLEHMLFYLIDNFFTISRVKKLSKCESELDGHPINSNAELLSFNVKSRSITWTNIVAPLKHRNTRAVRLLGRNFNYLTNIVGNINFNDRPEILVCHDMMGNYLEDRFYESSRKWDFYKFYHWSGIDYFCYFSHKYITIPPCGWISAAHLHGVKVVGTFITEGDSGTQLILDVLSSRERIREVCNALTRLCEHFCFEGWLINVECKVPTDKVGYLKYFIDTLRLTVSTKIPNGVVFWYDSIINNGDLNWQNELNDRNIQYFNNSNGTLINYNWNDQSLQNTKEILEKNNKKLSQAFFGIDVFGRGQLAKFHSSKTLARIAQNNFSVGIFAPGWTFEALQNFNYNIFELSGSDHVNDAFLRRNEKFWWLLWEYLATHPYTEQPFFTSFCVGSGKKKFVFGQQRNEKFYNLCRQNLQPSIPLDGFAERYFDDAVSGGSCLKIMKTNESFRLFITNFVVEKSFVFGYAFKLDESVGEFDLILRISDNQNQDCYLMCGDYRNIILEKGRCYLSPIPEKHLLKLNHAMFTENIPIKLPFVLSNNWKVRYYCVTFDNLVYVKDIGVLFRKHSNIDDAQAYLGAVYFNSMSNGLGSATPGNVLISNQNVLVD